MPWDAFPDGMTGLLVARVTGVSKLRYVSNYGTYDAILSEQTKL